MFSGGTSCLVLSIRNLHAYKYIFPCITFDKDVLGFPGGSDRTESADNPADLGLITGSGKSPGETVEHI